MKHFLMMTALCAVLRCGAAAAQDEPDPADGCIGHGIAQIVAGDIPDARQRALLDAQKKCMIAAVGSLVPCEALTGGIGLLKPRLLAQPEQYIERFKIIRENTRAGCYIVTVQAYPQQERLRSELEDAGLLPRQEVRPQALLLIAEREEPRTEDVCWWTAPAGAARPGNVHAGLAEKLARQGITVADVSGAIGTADSAGRAGCPDVTPADACRIAGRFNAAYVLTGRSTLSFAKDGDMQCTLSVNVIDVRTQEIVLQAAAAVLGRRAAPQGPAAEAVDKACSQLVEQIAERFFQQARAVRTYTFRLTFTKTMAREDVQRCMNAFAGVLPGLAVQDMRSEAGGMVWSVQATSPAQSAEELQEQFGQGVPGYVSKIISARDARIEMRVAPIARSGE